MTDDSVERFRLLVEQLEAICKLLDAKAPTEAKIAIILLDSLADALLYRRCIAEFERDSYLSKVIRPRFNDAKRREVLWDFKAKVNMAISLKLVNTEDGDVLKIGHSYRNSAYHRDVHNPTVTNDIGRILFGAMCRLFRSYYDNGASVGGSSPSEWGLTGYGTFTSLISFRGASRAVADKLLEGTTISIREAATTLHGDVEGRLDRLRKKIAEIPTLDTDEALDEGLKRAEFENEHTYEEFSGELRELNYKIASDRGDEVTRDEYRKAERLFKRRQKKALGDFRPTCSAALLKRLAKSQRIRKARSLSTLLLAYRDVDSQLSVFEQHIESIDLAFESAVNLADEIRRGK